ncbi:hypothetical protein [Sphingobacterium bambusae]|uniref:Uncharacterized protein n=1 Tax=Sphingobacterium bambusae TaxID=662858 RepID=A0ABW6BIL7_9SPHI|nr:hypothetical protein [Sphingobacterium bambusae]WPL49681.1 hypothetical protein SCB77_04350 [Sphingobacterium bambusae]
MNAKQLLYIMVALIAVAVTITLVTTYFNVESTFLTAVMGASFLLILPASYMHMHAVKRELEELIRTSNTDLHAMYDVCYRFKAPDHAIKELYKNLNKIQADYKDHFARETSQNKDVFRFLDTEYDKASKRTLLILQKKVLTLPHSIAKRMLEAFSENYL